MSSGIFDSDDHSSGVSLDSTSLYDISANKAAFYYWGISPSPPKLVYHTGKILWVIPTGPEAYPKPKMLCGVFGHKINNIWDMLGPKVCSVFLISLTIFSMTLTI
jgi:hypothetical protein